MAPRPGEVRAPWRNYAAAKPHVLVRGLMAIPPAAPPLPSILSRMEVKHLTRPGVQQRQVSF